MKNNVYLFYLPEQLLQNFSSYVGNFYCNLATAKNRQLVLKSMRYITKKNRVFGYSIKPYFKKPRCMGFTCKGGMVSASSAEEGRHDKYPNS